MPSDSHNRCQITVVKQKHEEILTGTAFCKLVKWPSEHIALLNSVPWVPSLLL